MIIEVLRHAFSCGAVSDFLFEGGEIVLMLRQLDVPE